MGADYMNADSECEPGMKRQVKPCDWNDAKRENGGVQDTNKWSVLKIRQWVCMLMTLSTNGEFTSTKPSN